MLTAFRGLYAFLTFSLVLNFTMGSDSGCDYWTISGSDVCCNKCKPGNRLVERCGRDPQTLCSPCDPDTYTTSFTFFCLRCTQCTGKQFTRTPCTISSDTVCGCKPGYRCGDDKCSFCVTECKEGEEPTQNRLCRKCPKGKFNDKIHSNCREWKKSCPDGQMLGKGNATSDCTCIYSDEEAMQTTLHVVSNKKEETKWLPVFIAGGMAGLAVLCIIASVAAYVKGRNKTEKKPKTDTADQDSSDESRNMATEQEDCSYRHPEQEQGGSSDSIDTQDSDSKLIV